MYIYMYIFIHIYIYIYIYWDLTQHKGPNSPRGIDYFNGSSNSIKDCTCVCSAPAFVIQFQQFWIDSFK